MDTVPSNIPPTPLGDAATQMVVLAFDLLGEEVVNLPSLLQKSLSDKKVQDAIESALDSFMLKRMTSGAGLHDLTPKDANDLLTAIANSASGKLGDAALNQIKNSPEYKRLEKAFAEFQSAAKATPMGVWVDKNSAVVYVTGIALVIAGAAVLYATKTGGALNNAVISQVKDKPIQVFKIGNFSLKGELLAFQPETRNLGVGAIATEKWQGLQVSFTVGAIAANTTVQQVNGALAVKVNEVNVTLSATDNLAKKTANLGLSLGFDDGPLKPLKVGVGVVITGGKATGGTLDASMKIPMGELGVKGQVSGNAYSGLATWTYHF